MMWEGVTGMPPRGELTGSGFGLLLLEGLAQTFHKHGFVALGVEAALTQLGP
jgi:hypothetical protein